MAFNLALRLCGDATEAEDICQDALLRAVKGLPAFRGDSDPSTWVYRIVVNVWKTRARKAKPLPLIDEPVERGPETPAEARDLIERALARMEPEERAVLVLRELDGRTYEEISEALEIPLGTVKSRLARARDVLAALLAPEEEKDAA